MSAGGKGFEENKAGCQGWSGKPSLSRCHQSGAPEVRDQPRGFVNQPVRRRGRGEARCAGGAARLEWLEPSERGRRREEAWW